MPEKIIRESSGTQPPQQDRFQNNILVGLVLLGSGTAMAMTQYKVPTVMIQIMDLFNMDAISASWLMSIFTLMSIFVALPSGLLAQRFGAKSIMIIASGIAIVGSLIGIFAETSSILIFSRAIEGIALTALTTCGPIVIQRCVRTDKVGTTMGIWGIWGCLGSTVAALFTPILFETIGFKGLWATYATVAAIAAFLVATIIRCPKANRIEVDGSAVLSATAANVGKNAVNTSNTRKTEAVITTNNSQCRNILSGNTTLFFVGFAIFNICLLAILSFVPTILQMQGFDPTLSGLISTAPMLLSIVSSPLFGAIADKTDHCKPLLITAMCVMGPCTYILYTNTGLIMWAAVIIMGLIGMGGIGLFLTGYMKLLPKPELASLGMGLMITIQGIGQFLGTFLVQMLLGPELLNWWFAGMVILAMGLVGTVCLAFCKLR